MQSYALEDELKSAILTAVAGSDLSGAARKRLTADLSVSLIEFSEDTLKFSTYLGSNNWDDRVVLTYDIRSNNVSPLATDQFGDDICHESGYMSATFERSFYTAADKDFEAVLTEVDTWPCTNTADAAALLSRLFITHYLTHGVHA